MKSQIEKESNPKTYKITIELWPDDHAGLKEMADYLGATVKQVIEALVSGQPEDYLNRKEDEIWESLVGYIEDNYGTTPRLELVKRHLQACDANSDLPSIGERRVLWNWVLQNADNYASHLAKLEQQGFSVEQDRTVTA